MDIVDDGPSLSLAARRPRRENRRMPARFRDELPKPQAALPPPVASNTGSNSEDSARSLSPTHSTIGELASRFLKSPLNSFGLYRQYHAIDFPSHDPEAETNYTGLSDVPFDHPDSQASPSSLAFFPYPNENAFLLGEWYWNEGEQKTSKNFQKLMDIVGRPDFNPDDVRDIPWNSINKALGDSSDSDDMWLDEPDSGWMETPISISVPFHRLTQDPGPQEFIIPSFRHRSIVSILKEKMANSEDFSHFHLEPYKLQWKKGTPDCEPIRVYGELYTSPAFLSAYEEIQNLSKEPGCTLPRVLVGLLFGSDGTQLTSFGSASLWPCYMYFGNESKYRRCKPSHKLCNHIAYFQKVSSRFIKFNSSKVLSHLSAST
jgi:Plavaka transposase